MNRETFIVGDLHGSKIELDELLDKIKFDPKTIRLIFCGDLEDRGLYSAECIWFVRSLCEAGQAECLMGNHDQKHCRYRAHEIRQKLTGTPNPMRPMKPSDLEAHKKLSDADIAWMRNLPLKIHLKDNWYAIHGGLEPIYDLDHQSPDQIIRCRYVSNGKALHKNGKPIEFGKAIPLNKDKSQPINTYYWADVWNGEQSIVYGHMVHSLNKPLITERPNGIKCIGIDTGCVYGGFLTGYFLERNEFVQVKAKQEYAHLHSQFNED